MSSPLADRIRPADITEIIGQAHLLGPGKPLAQALAAAVGVVRVCEIGLTL